jgi:hypothetical protein
MARNGGETTGTASSFTRATCPAGVAPPPPAEASAEEKDRYWYTHVYQGDRVPQLTFRAVAMGAVLGMMMSVSLVSSSSATRWR